jgi:hypothetical protein
MIEIEEVSWSNFFSYGTEVTTLNFTGLGPCFVTGSIKDQDEDLADGALRPSSGSGKSTAVNIIPWILFGRTVHDHNPGDAVLNNFTTGDAVGTMKFKNGDSITRIRKRKGGQELLVNLNGSEQKWVGDTLSTIKTQQQKLNQQLRLDWDLFCGAVFFGQSGKLWLDMADSARKRSMERLLRLDRFSYYAAAAKHSKQLHDNDATFKSNQLATMQQEVIRLTAQIAEADRRSAEFDGQRQLRRDQLLGRATEVSTKLAAHTVPDVVKLTKKWEIVTAADRQLTAEERRLDQLRNQRAHEMDRIAAKQREITNWQNDTDTTCNSCRQNIGPEHAATQIAALQAAIDELRAKVAQIDADLSGRSHEVKQARVILQEKRPKVSVAVAKEMVTLAARYQADANDYTAQAAAVLDEANPYASVRLELEGKIADLDRRMAVLRAEIDAHNLTAKHYEYVAKAYSDRDKVKSQVFQHHIPFINQRMAYYLELLNLDLTTALTDSLAFTSDNWSHKYQSAGERARTNLALMLSIFDLHEHLYGRQCNVMVLDEVDSKFDEYSLPAFASLVNSELAPKLDAVMVLSHRNSLNDIFPTQLHVEREHRISRLLRH